MSRHTGDQIVDDPTCGNGVNTNPLAATPSSNHLAHSKLVEEDDPLYSNKFSKDYSGLFMGSADHCSQSRHTLLSESVMGPTINGACSQPPVLGYKRSLQLPKGLVYYIYMQNILSGHCTVDLTLFQDIN